MGGVVDITREYHDARKALRKTIKRLKPDVPEPMIMAAMVDELLRYCGDEEGRKSAQQWMDYKLADIRSREAFARQQKRLAR
ncbi:MAG: hypothetical protein GEV05_24335 [Betaproteobacteria bacterium]|nr:hypothetical protein [Betaproteobacteria bacterium]